MFRIEKLTKAQIDRFPEFVEKWTKIGLSTDPADRKRAEAGILKAYRLAGLPNPQKIIWTTSPLVNGTIAILKKGASVRTSVWASVRDSIWAIVGDNVGDSVGASVWAIVRENVRDSVWDNVWDNVGASVVASVWDSVGASVGDSVRASVGNSVYGSHEAGWLSFYNYFDEVCGLRKETAKLDGLIEISKSANWLLPYQDICFISERHNILHLDEHGRLHNETGPALAYPDGFSIFAVHGVRVSSEIIEQPHAITVKAIENQNNVEIRRVMIERYGIARFLLDSGAKKIHNDPYGTLYRKEIPDDEPLVMVQVQNSTPEPDGSFKSYFLRVPPEMQTAKQAVAWTFEQNPEEYQPMFES